MKTILGSDQVNSGKKGKTKENKKQSHVNFGIIEKIWSNLIFI